MYRQITQITVLDYATNTMLQTLQRMHLSSWELYMLTSGAFQRLKDWILLWRKQEDEETAQSAVIFKIINTMKNINAFDSIVNRYPLIQWNHDFLELGNCFFIVCSNQNCLWSIGSLVNSYKFVAILFMDNKSIFVICKNFHRESVFKMTV